MSHLPYHQQQLEFMIELARNRPEFLDPFFQFLNYFDTPYFFFLLIPLIWLGFSYRWGMRIFYWLMLNNLINSYAKFLVGWPRPSTLFPNIGFFHPTSNGFPSGGAQTCMFLGALLIYYWKNRAAWPIGLCYILLISFSRLYLGVHYPIDVLGGWLFGLSLAILLIKTKDPVEKWLIQQGNFFCLVLNLLIASLLMLIFPYTYNYYMMGAIIGVGIGTYFSLKYHLFLTQPKDLNEGIGRAFIGIAFLFLIMSLLPEGTSFSKSLVTGFFMSFAASPICKWFLQKKI